MTATAAIAAAIPAAVLIIAIGVHEVRRKLRDARDSHEAAARRFDAVRARVAGGFDHGGRSTPGATASPIGKGAHVSAPAERSQNHG